MENVDCQLQVLENQDPILEITIDDVEDDILNNQIGIEGEIVTLNMQKFTKECECAYKILPSWWQV